MKKKLLCVLVGTLAIPTAWGCRVSPIYNAYQKQGRDVVYVSGVNYQDSVTLTHLPEVNFSKLRLLRDPARPEEWRYNEEPPESDYIYEGVNSTKLTTAYYSDGRYVIWAGEIVRNPPGTPAVDIATFRIFGRFAADKHSLYFDGKRTEANQGVDMATLAAVPFGEPWYNSNGPGSATVLRDQHHLYLRGHRADNPDSFRVLAQKPWDQRGMFYSINACADVPIGPWDTLARTTTQVIINGLALDADPDSFTVVRWIPGTLLIYRDKNGVRRISLDLKDKSAGTPNHALGSKDCSATFNMLEDKVTWRKTWQGEDCEVETLPGLDPEQFHPLNNSVAQYQDRLYSVKTSEFGEDYLEVITLDDPNLVINKRFSADKHHGYLLTTKEELEVFDSAGPLVLLGARIPDEWEAHTEDSQYRPNWFARDDRYVYVFTGAQLYRYKTAWPHYAHVTGQRDKGGYGFAYSRIGGTLVTLEGYYYQDQFAPRKNKSPGQETQG